MLVWRTQKFWHLDSHWKEKRSGTVLDHVQSFDLNFCEFSVSKFALLAVTRIKSFNIWTYPEISKISQSMNRSFSSSFFLFKKNGAVGFLSLTVNQWSFSDLRHLLIHQNSGVDHSFRQPRLFRTNDISRWAWVFNSDWPTSRESCCLEVWTSSKPIRIMQNSLSFQMARAPASLQHRRHELCLASLRICIGEDV